MKNDFEVDEIWSWNFAPFWREHVSYLLKVRLFGPIILKIGENQKWGAEIFCKLTNFLSLTKFLANFIVSDLKVIF